MQHTIVKQYFQKGTFPQQTPIDNENTFEVTRSAIQPQNNSCSHLKSVYNRIKYFSSCTNSSCSHQKSFCSHTKYYSSCTNSSCSHLKSVCSCVKYFSSYKIALTCSEQWHCKRDLQFQNTRLNIHKRLCMCIKCHIVQKVMANY